MPAPKERNTIILEGAVPARKRILRACDQCRRRKTKCNGHLNCYSCWSFGFDCTYGQEFKKTRGPVYVARLERALKDLQDQIKGAPSASPSNHNTRCESDMFSVTAGSSATTQSVTNVEYLDTLGYPQGYSIPAKADGTIPYSSCSGIEILRRMRVGVDAMTGFPTPASGAYCLTGALDRSMPDFLSLPSSSFHVFSPSKANLLHFIRVAYRDSFWFSTFVDREYVEAAVDRVYNTNPTSTSPCPDKDEIALVYAIAANGDCLDTNSTSTNNCDIDAVSWRGVTYFRTVQSLVDPINCERSLLALQTVVCMAIYLITASAMSRAHMFIGMAAAAAVRMGLHLPSTGANAPDYERMVRKRTYRSIMAIDIYMATFLGQPCCLAGVDDHLENGPQSDVNELALLHPTIEREIGAASCMDVFTILRSATEKLYFSGSKHGQGGIYSVPCLTIRSHNQRLDDWFASVGSLKVSGQTKLFVLQTGAYAQMVINSPFLHYLALPTSIRSHDGNIAGGKCCMGAIRAVELLQSLKVEDRLNEANAFFLRSLTYAAMSLLFVEFSGLDVPSIDTVMSASSLAESLLEHMAARHAAALACYESLLPLYQTKKSIVRSLPELTSSSTESSWTSLSVDGCESLLSPATGTMSFLESMFQFEHTFD